jgi:hypothetical protein
MNTCRPDHYESHKTTFIYYSYILTDSFFAVGVCFENECSLISFINENKKNLLHNNLSNEHKFSFNLKVFIFLCAHHYFVQRTTIRFCIVSRVTSLHVFSMAS